MIESCLHFESLKTRIADLRPNEVAFMEPAPAPPYTRAIPDQHLDAIAGTDRKDKPTRKCFYIKFLLQAINLLGQCLSDSSKAILPSSFPKILCAPTYRLRLFLWVEYFQNFAPFSRAHRFHIYSGCLASFYQ